MLSGDTTSESPSAREVAVFNARPCEQQQSEDFKNSVWPDMVVPIALSWGRMGLSEH